MYTEFWDVFTHQGASCGIVVLPLAVGTCQVTVSHFSVFRKFHNCAVFGLGKFSGRIGRLEQASLPRPFRCRLFQRNTTAESNLCFAVQHNRVLKSTAVAEKKPRKLKSTEKRASKNVNSRLNSVRRVSQ